MRHSSLLPSVGRMQVWSDSKACDWSWARCFDTEVHFFAFRDSFVSVANTEKFLYNFRNEAGLNIYYQPPCVLFEFTMDLSFSRKITLKKLPFAIFLWRFYAMVSFFTFFYATMLMLFLFHTTVTFFTRLYAICHPQRKIFSIRG